MEGASKHWDQILTGEDYGSKPGKSTDGYLTWSRWQVKPGQMHAYVELNKKSSTVSARIIEDVAADFRLDAFVPLPQNS